MKLILDTNVLVRTIICDDPAQASVAFRCLEAADIAVVSNACLCELVWVLKSVYRLRRDDIGSALRGLTAIGSIIMDRPACDAGLAVLDAGGDFADGLIAHEGAWLGGETFVSFDKQATRLLQDQGRQVQLLSG